ncbi:TetR/AcrR family transcriptional regulator [Exilibacterium tricleocarpae]|uniref:TetR/AcrR family transcriptional regulator n=1 Tax=Exilibacterium tricleocarpae TaxID=2591008 RepID=UPI0024831E7D|nr:TetR family transcriptional regulator [Exilibacterium tricleocarpae]
MLEAALRVIADQGYRALTHRAVAREAGVNLSLTTYYFKDLSQLVAEAFTHYKDALHREAGGYLQAALDYLDRFDKAALADAAVRREIADSLARTMTDYLEHHIREHPQGVAVEMTFFFDLHLDESQRELAHKLRSRFLADFVAVCRRLGTAEPETDAELIMGTLQHLECQAIAVPGQFRPDTISRQLSRLMRALVA